MICSRSIGDDLALLDALPHMHDRLLIDTRILVRTLKLRQRINIHPGFQGILPIARIRSHDDPGRIHADHCACILGDDDRAGIPSRDILHASADQGGLRAQQRHRLPLHVRPHQRPVGIVVLEEGNQRCGHTHELLRRDIHVVDFFYRDENKFAPLASCHDIA